MIFQYIAFVLITIVFIIELIYLYDIVFVFKTPYISLENSTIEEILSNIKIKPGDKFYELGCGDGRVLHIASQNHKNSFFIGIEKAIRPYLLARIKNKEAKHVTIKRADIRKVDLSEADIVFMYLMPDLINKIEPTLKNIIANGGKVVAVEFCLPHTKPRKAFKLKNKSMHAKKWFIYHN